MVNTTTSASSTIQDQVSTMLVQPLEAASVVLSSGATIFNSSEPLRIPRLTGSTAVAWVGEGEQIPDDYTADFDELSLMPTNRKSIKAIVRVTNELIRQAKMGVSGVLQQRLVHDVKTKLDDALLNGDGTDNTVTGVLNQAGTQDAVLDLADPDSLLDALALATAAEVQPNRWIFNGGDFYTLRKVKDGDGRYILESDITSDTQYRLFGVPVTVSNRMPAGKGLLMDTKQLAVVRDIDPQVKILDQKYADTDETGIRVVTRYDLGLIHPEGVVVLTAATP
ncbi:phage major capsid protein [Dietzia sp. 111N12-1]|uniref:phage major capsid protein n=1 Tax=Dietzia sp. 111N12-1 TaxID=1785156 RepID=UPI00080495D9|nr:phage major capsid protein [Dietzia sp. 111N12-1]OAV78092.1 capsid protein [Dietzia sp. 111N12-1]